MEVNVITLIFGLIGTIVGIFMNLSNFARVRERDQSEKITEQAMSNAKLDNIATSVNSICVDIKSLEKDNARFMEGLIKAEQQALRAEQSAGNAHKRIDRVEERLNER